MSKFWSSTLEKSGKYRYSKGPMISVVLATYNESSNIERCLKSVSSFADEIILVDGSSTDNTRDLAKKLGAKVIKTTNKPNFHINKQMAMDKAKGDLVLQLDADEEVDGELAVFITNIHDQIQKNETLEHAAWWIKRKNLFLNRFLTKGGQYPDPVIRLYLRGKAKLPQEDVHEQMVVDGSTGWAEGHLIHYSNPTFAAYMQKFNTYTSFQALQFFQDKQALSPGFLLSQFIWKPLTTFVSIYVRHKGFVDGFPGFVFALMSSLHFPVVALKLWEQYATDEN